MFLVIAKEADGKGLGISNATYQRYTSLMCHKGAISIESNYLATLS